MQSAADKIEMVRWLRQQPGMQQQARRGVSTGHAVSPISSGLPQLDALLDGGYPRGAITELTGDRGGMSLALCAVASATLRGELVAWLDPLNALDPLSARAAGVQLEQLLWMRPQGEQNLAKAIVAGLEQLAQADSFALAVLDLGAGKALAGVRRGSWWVRLAQQLRAHRMALVVIGELHLFCSHLRLLCASAPGRPQDSCARGFALQLSIVRRRGHAPGGMVNVFFAPPTD